jgi:hypothetical protein
METLEPPECLESLREEVDALERANARLRQKLARLGRSVVPGDRRLRAVFVIMIALYVAVFSWAHYEGRHFDWEGASAGDGTVL